MKKLLSALLALAMAGTLAAPALAASSVSVTRNITDLSGNPIDEDGNQTTGDTVAPGQTIYFMLPGSAGRILNDSKNFKITVKKTKNAKLVKKVSLSEKKLGRAGTSYAVPNGFKMGDSIGGLTPTKTSDLYNAVAANSRATYLAVQLNDTSSTDEIKVEMNVTFTARKNAANGSDYGFTYGTGSTSISNGVTTGSMVANPAFLATPLKSSGDKLTFKLSFYVANPSDTGDSNITVGTAGVSYKPVKNDYNEVTFEGSADTLATLTFKANSDPDKMYLKLTTKWTSDLLSKFRDTDAVIRRFSPTNISSTSRATLALNNPFDEDEVNPKNVYIYTVSSSGKLSLINGVKYNSDDDTFELQTRTLGTYVISNKKIRL